MYRDGEVLSQTRGKRWIIRGVKMSEAQMKSQIKQQISDMEKRKAREPKELIQKIFR